MANELIQKELEEIEEMVAEASEYEEYKEKVLILREGMVRLTGNLAKAALLSSLIGWTEHWLKTDNEVYKQIREAADKNDLAKIRRLKEQIRQGWFYKSYEDMSKELMDTISKSTAERYCKEFEEKGFIWSRDPEEKATYRAKWYKANIDLIREELNKMGFDLDYYKMQKRQYNNPTSQNGKCIESRVLGDEDPKSPVNRISQNGKPSHQNGKSPHQNGKHLLYTTTNSSTTDLNSRYVGSNLSTVMDLFSQAYKLTGYARQKLTELVEMYGEILVLEALDRTIAAEKDRPIAYIKGILRKWSKAGVNTTEDIEKYERNFRDEQSRKKQRKQKRPQHEDKLPEAIQMQMEQKKENKQKQTESQEEKKRKEDIEEKRKRIQQKLEAMRKQHEEKQKPSWMKA